jgi:hypothetical protein
MRKVPILLIIILVLGPYMAHAQGDKSSNKVGGIRAGYHAATLVLRDSDVDTTNVLGGFYAGFYRDNKVASILHIGTGLEYFKNGTEYSKKSSRVLHTISVPVSLKVKLGPVFALGGIGANFKVSEKLVYNDTNYDLSDDQKSNWFDAPAFLGAGVKLWFLTLEARYHWGLIEANNGYYNRYFQLGAGISF